MIKVELTQYISRPPEEVFAFLANFENRPLWESDVVEAKQASAGQVGPGTTIREVRKGRISRMVSTYVIEEFEPDHRIRFKTRSGPLFIQSTHTLEAMDGGTRVSFTLEITPRGMMGLFGPLVAWLIRRNLRTNHRTLKKLLEAKT